MVNRSFPERLDIDAKRNAKARWRLPSMVVVGLGSICLGKPAFADTYTYDGAGRLASVTRAGTTTTFKYDGLGGLDSVCSGSSCRAIVIDDVGGARVVGEVGGTTRVFARGPGGFQSLQEGASAPTYSVVDAQGSVRGQVRADGTLTSRAGFDAYGLRRETGPVTQPGPAFAGEYRAEADLTWLRARWYAPETGRFLSRDTFEGNAELAVAKSLHVC
jgi:RHS repeat-associated protein